MNEMARNKYDQTWLTVLPKICHAVDIPTTSLEKYLVTRMSNWKMALSEIWLFQDPDLRFPTSSRKILTEFRKS